jgi:hypothetical protein
MNVTHNIVHSTHRIDEKIIGRIFFDIEVTYSDRCEM